MTKVTVGLNVYNGMPYLPEAVDSLLNQTLEDFRLVIVNDGSTDGSRDYLESLTDPRVQVIHQENGGCSVASNVVINQCTTPYLARMDADDIALPDRLQKQLDFMESHPEVGMVGTQTACMGDETVGKSIKLPSSHRAIWKALIEGHHAMCHPTVMMRTPVIQGIDGYWQYGELDDDTDMMLRMGEAADLANLDEPLYHYRVHQGSLSGSGMRRVRFSYEYSIELAHRRRLGLPSLTPDEYRELRAGRPTFAHWLDSLDIHARCQYRVAVEEIFGGKPIRGRLRLCWAALCSPRLTVQRVKRMMRIPSQQL